MKNHDNALRVRQLAGQFYPGESDYEQLVQVIADLSQHLEEDTHGKRNFSGLAFDVRAELAHRQRTKPAQNFIRVIYPYWHNGSLVFDDAAVGLAREPFVAGADTALGALASQIPGCEERFTLNFSDQPFPGYQTRAQWLHAEGNGNWYEFVDSGVKGWLCPALLKYFDEAPQNIFIEIRRSE